MLGTILDSVRAGLPAVQSRRTELLDAAQAQPAPRDFARALVGPRLSVIAEVKRRSPSRGVIDAAVDPVGLAQQYEAGGAAAISVLTEPTFFDGSLHDLECVRRDVALPVLRKDFILDEAQIWEARAAGADSVLLIVAALEGSQLAELLAAARAVGMEPLVEVHTAADVEVALGAGARIVGVNNRDLTTFEVDLATAEALRVELGDVVAVAESGIWTSDDAARMHAAGYDAVLVGESLVRSDSPADVIAAWTGDR